MFILPHSWVIMLLYDSFTIALRYSVKLPFSQFAREYNHVSSPVAIKFTSAANPDSNLCSIFYTSWHNSFVARQKERGTHNVHSFLTDNCFETIHCNVDFGICRSSSNCLYVILLFNVIAFRTTSTDSGVATSDGRPVCGWSSRTQLPRRNCIYQRSTVLTLFFI